MYSRDSKHEHFAGGAKETNAGEGLTSLVTGAFVDFLAQQYQQARGKTPTPDDLDQLYAIAALPATQRMLAAMVENDDGRWVERLERSRVHDQRGFNKWSRDLYLFGEPYLEGDSLPLLAEVIDEEDNVGPPSIYRRWARDFFMQRWSQRAVGTEQDSRCRSPLEATQIDDR